MATGAKQKYIIVAYSGAHEFSPNTHCFNLYASPTKSVPGINVAHCEKIPESLKKLVQEHAENYRGTLVGDKLLPLGNIEYGLLELERRKTAETTLYYPKQKMDFYLGSSKTRGKRVGLFLELLATKAVRKMFSPEMISSTEKPSPTRAKALEKIGLQRNRLGRFSAPASKWVSLLKRHLKESGTI